MGPGILSSIGVGFWRKAPEAFPDSNTTLDTFQSARHRRQHRQRHLQDLREHDLLSKCNQEGFTGLSAELPFGGNLVQILGVHPAVTPTLGCNFDFCAVILAFGAAKPESFD